MAWETTDLARVAAEAFDRVYGAPPHDGTVPRLPSDVRVGRGNDTGGEHGLDDSAHDMTAAAMLRAGLLFGVLADARDPASWSISESSLPFAPAAFVANACLLGFPDSHRGSVIIQHACAFIAWLDAREKPWQSPFFAAWLAASGLGEGDVRYHFSLPVQLRELARGIDLPPRDLRAMLVSAIAAGVVVDATYLLWWLRFVATGSRPLPSPNAACIHFATSKLFMASCTMPRSAEIRAECSAWHPFAPSNSMFLSKVYKEATREATPHNSLCYQVNYGLLDKIIAILACTPGRCLSRPGDLGTVLDVPGMLARINPVQGNFGDIASGACYVAVYSIPRRSFDAVKAYIKELANQDVIHKWKLLAARSFTIVVNWNAYVPGFPPSFKVAPARADPRLVLSTSVDYTVPSVETASCVTSVLSKPRPSIVRFIDCLNSPFMHGEGLRHEATAKRVATFCGTRPETVRAWMEEYVHRRKLFLPDPRVAMYLNPNAGFLAKVLFTGSGKGNVPWDMITRAIPVITRLDCTDEGGHAFTFFSAGVASRDVHHVIATVHEMWPRYTHGIELTSRFLESRQINMSFVSKDGKPDPRPVLAAGKDAVARYASGNMSSIDLARVLSPIGSMAGVDGA